MVSLGLDVTVAADTGMQVRLRPSTPGFLVFGARSLAPNLNVSRANGLC